MRRPRIAAASCRAPGRLCREHANCCSGLCGPKDATGRRTCQCRTATDCPPPSNKCLKATCDAGICGAVVTTGAACDDRNPCTTNDVCQTDGACRGTPKDCSGAATDPCHIGVCEAGTGACVSQPRCGTGTVCAGSECVACGALGQFCCTVYDPAAVPCQEGAACDLSVSVCEACGADGQLCCAGDTCAAGFACVGVGPDRFCKPCGAEGQPCCAGNTCAVGAACDGAFCHACGGTLQVCCTFFDADATPCQEGRVCFGGDCTPCGFAGQLCCPNATCFPGATCVNGFCQP